MVVLVYKIVSEGGGVVGSEKEKNKMMIVGKLKHKSV